MLADRSIESHSRLSTKQNPAMRRNLRFVMAQAVGCANAERCLAGARIVVTAVANIEVAHRRGDLEGAIVLGAA